MKYSPRHFALFRISLGGYLLIHFATLLPYAQELFGAHSFFATAPRFSLVKQVFPNVLDVPQVSSHAVLFVSLLMGCAGAFMLGIGRRLVAVALWYGLACLVNRNPGIMNPSHAFVGWLCLASAIVPNGERWRRGASEATWEMPAALFSGAWLVMACAYSTSGLAKLQISRWIDGSAFALTLDMVYAREGWARAALLSLPDPVLHLCTWLVLTVELLFLPLALVAVTRRFVWLALVVLHGSLLILFDFWELSVGMLLFHVFTFDERWLAGERS